MFPRRCPARWLPLAASALLLCGWAKNSRRIIDTPDALSTPPWHVTLEWESALETDGEMTGIESATNLAGPWICETQFLLVQVTNAWTDTNPAPAKFYRAFNE